LSTTSRPKTSAPRRGRSARRASVEAAFRSAGVLSWIGAKGALSADTIKLFLIGLPALFAGTWLGLKLFGRLDEAAFRKIVLALLLASGAVLIV
jgi:uncharacterized membrane protein YfcA